MIVVDTSAIIAILLKEPQARDCLAALSKAGTVLISAATLTETHIVAGQKDVSDLLFELLNFVRLEVITLDEQAALRAAEGYALWGKNYHKAEINYGDSFSYALAKSRDCPLLFIGNDFSQSSATTFPRPTSSAPSERCHDFGSSFPRETLGCLDASAS